MPNGNSIKWTQATFLNCVNCNGSLYLSYDWLLFNLVDVYNSLRYARHYPHVWYHFGLFEYCGTSKIAKPATPCESMCVRVCLCTRTRSTMLFPTLLFWPSLLFPATHQKQLISSLSWVAFIGNSVVCHTKKCVTHTEHTKHTPYVSHSNE